MKLILNWLIQHFLFSGFLMFAAAPVVMGGSEGGAEPSEAVEGAETVDDAEPVEGGEGAEPAEGAEKPEVPGQKPEVKVDARGLPPKVRETMEALKASDPKAHTWLKDKLFAEKAFREEFPKGIAEAKAVKAEYATFKQDFPNGVQGIKAEQAEWRSIDEAWQKADPKVLDTWMEANPQAFNKLMPTAINKFAGADPEGHARYMCSMLVNTMATDGILANMDYMAYALGKGDVEAAKALFTELQKWVKGKDEFARSKPKEPQINPQADAQARANAEKETQLWNKETAMDIQPMKITAINKELKNYTKDASGKPLEIDEDTMIAIHEKIHKWLAQGLAVDSSFQQQFNAFDQARDREGVKKLMAAKMAEAFPSKNGKAGLVEKAYKLFFRGATPKPKTKAGVPPAKPGAPPVQGWTKVAQPPKPHEIDHGRSPFGLKVQKAAILPNGKKIFWGDAAPTGY